MEKLGIFFSQSFRIPYPTLTQKNLPSQNGRVFVVTGGNAGVGFELTKILHAAGGTVYIAGRSSARCNAAIDTIKAAQPDSPGHLEFLPLDLSDFDSIRAAAKEFLAKEERLDVLVNNAGILEAIGQKSRHNIDLVMTVNCLGPFLFTKLLTPVLESTAKSSPENTIRVLWAGSSGMDLRTPEPGILFSAEPGPDVPIMPEVVDNYGISKCGNYYLGLEYALRIRDVISVSFNPGNLKSELFQSTEGPKALLYKLLFQICFYPPIFGAYTELWAGWSDEIDRNKNGAYVIPWGRLANPRMGVLRGAIRGQAGGEGRAKLFWGWCEAVTREWAEPLSAQE